MKKVALGAALMMLVAACASTLSPRDRIFDQLIGFGFSDKRATCVSDELDMRLARDELSNVADFFSGLNDIDGFAGLRSAILSIDDPDTAQASARAFLACVF